MDLKETVLSSTHQELGAKMASFAGFNMPLQYSSVKEEVLAVRNSVGVFDVSHMGEFYVTGPDAEKFVDYLLPNDFLGAGKAKAVYSPLCREDGTIIDDLIAYKIKEDRVLLCVNASNIQKDWDWISSKTDGFDIDLSNKSEEVALLALQGPNAPEILVKSSILTSEEVSSEKLPYYSILEKEFEGEKVLIARTGYTGEDGFEVFSSPSLTKKIWGIFQKNSVTPCGLASRDVLRLEVGYPLYGNELGDDYTPLDCALKWTVKLNKEKFLGKSSLEKYTPKFRLVKLSMEDKGIPRAGHEILNESEEVIGKVTSGTFSVVLKKGICMGLVRKEQFPKDKKFKIKIRKNIASANYHAKAFIQGGHK